uniref:F-box-like family protein n=1 Tax=Pithovirus LCPAC401 TaxID=2506595 RepID=A0A481ZB10_9VIRU|nr:MAG: F-box-like family protein [Pithovirus LCPAC401]
MFPSDILQKIFTYLNVVKIVRLCVINSHFNLVCRRESLWKDVAWDHYKHDIIELTWKDTTRELFIASEDFWNDIDDLIKYYMSRGSGILNERDRDNLISKFQLHLIDQATKERKGWKVIEHIFKFYFTESWLYTKPPVDNKYYVNFIPLFKRVGKLSLRRILLLNDIEEMEQNNIATGYPTSIEWCYNDSFLILTSIYHNYPDLFIDDTIPNQKDEMKLVRGGRAWLICGDF